MLVFLQLHMYTDKKNTNYSNYYVWPEISWAGFDITVKSYLNL